MIIGFRHRGLKRFYERDDRSKLPADLVGRNGVLLAALDEAQRIEDLDRPSFRLHPLKGNRAGEWSLTVRANWRIVFGFKDSEAFEWISSTIIKQGIYDAHAQSTPSWPWPSRRH